ncbi:MAG: hypothetical protein HQK50_15015 [Oligoflexia bacterium]|nr:hypothetical protein [Oligoflexia bacterium]MBF0366883.1 hypothetical protein [Oligoflexia bacterium]
MLVVFKLISLILLCFFYLGSLGFWIAPLEQELKGMRLWSLSLMAGIVVNYFLVMALPSLPLAMGVGALLALFSLWYGRKSLSLLKLGRGEQYLLFIIIPFIIHFIPRTLFLPISECDAKVIWSFHAKIIYYAQTLFAFDDWTSAAITSFSHPDYPKLFAIMGAEVATLAGVWNDYITRIVLFIFLVTALFSLVHFFKSKCLTLLLLVVALFSFPRYLGNGYMDGYLALYAGIALLSLGGLGKERHSITGALLASGVVLGLKNEGQLVLLSLIATSLLLMLPFKKPHLVFSKKNFLVAFAAFGGTLLWSLYKHHYQLQNDLQLFGKDSFSYALSRLSDASALSSIAHTLIIESGLYLGVILLFLLLATLSYRDRSLLQRVRSCYKIRLSFLALLLYFSGIFVIFLMTNRGLKWHLDTAGVRTVIVANIFLLVLNLYILEEHSRRNEKVISGDSGL